MKDPNGEARVALRLEHFTPAPGLGGTTALSEMDRFAVDCAGQRVRPGLRSEGELLPRRREPGGVETAGPADGEGQPPHALVAQVRQPGGEGA